MPSRATMEREAKKCALDEIIAPVLDIVTDTIYSYVET
jgi:hypothetical protein